MDVDVEEKIAFLEHFDMYINHMRSLNLVEWNIDDGQDPVFDDKKKQIGVVAHTTIQLTDFSRLFAQACIPENGFTLE